MVNVPKSFEQHEKELTDMRKLNSVVLSKVRYRAPSRTHRVQRLRAKQQKIVSKDQGVSQASSQDNDKVSSQDNDKVLNQDNIASTQGTKPLQINMISAAVFAMYSRKKNHELLTISLRDIEKALSNKP